MAGVHAWQGKGGTCMAGVCVAGDMQRMCMAGGMHA